MAIRLIVTINAAPGKGFPGGTFLQWERALGEHGAIDQVLATIERDNNGPVIGTTNGWRGEHRAGCPTHMKAQRP